MSISEQFLTSSPPQEETLYYVEENERLGRYLVAARDIKQGETIICEEPLLTAPSDSTNGTTSYRCLSCCMEMIDELTFRRCTTCYFPSCSPECDQASVHADNECKILCRNRVRFPPPSLTTLNKSIMVLRALLLRKKNEFQWRRMMEMESHFEMRRNKPNSIHADSNVIENIQYFFGGKNGDFREMPNPDDIRRISGIIDVNAHLLPQKVNGKATDAGVCHIFLETSLLSHSCVPNAAWTISLGPDLKLITRASNEIPMGTEICVSYDVGELFYGTIRRVIPMEISGLFICGCRRCLDPTELGTNMSTLICPHCRDGHLLSQNPTDSFSDWVCQNCSKTQSDEEILDILEILESEIQFPIYNLVFSCVEESISKLEAFEKDYSGVILHPNHYILQEVKLRWIKQQALSHFQHLSPTDVKNAFLPKCKQLKEFCTMLFPGSSDIKVVVECHYCQGLFHLKRLGEDLTGFPENIQLLVQELLTYFRSNSGFDHYASIMESMLE